MDRKFCVLVYSRFSEASRVLIDHIRNLPFDLPRVSGMTFIAADNPEIRKAFLNENITSVPPLIIDYFNGTRHQLTGDEIMVWLNEVVGEVRRDHLPPPETVRNPETVPPPLGSPPPPPERDDGISASDVVKKPTSLHSMALAMQKSREVDDKKPV